MLAVTISPDAIMERTNEWLPGIPSKTRGTRYFGNAVTRDLRRLREIFDQGRFRRYLVVRAWFEWVVTKGLDLYEDMDTRNKRSSADELSGFVKRVEAFAVANPNDTDTLVDMLVCPNLVPLNVDEAELTARQRLP